MSGMKILNVNTSIDNQRGGGTAERTYQISRLLSEGNKCTILCFESSLSEEQIQALVNVELVFLPYLNKRFYIPKISFKKIKEVVIAADIIHLMGHWTILNALVYYYAVKYKKSYVVSPAGALSIIGRSRILKIGYNALIGKRIVKNSSGHIAIATNEYEQYARYGVSPEKVTLIPNGINDDHQGEFNIQSFLNKYNLSRANYMLYVGRLSYIKGPDLLLEAFAKIAHRYTDWQLLVVGPEVDMLTNLKEIRQQNMLEERIHFLGYLSGHEKCTVYHLAKFLIIPSRKEAMSLVALEAGISGKPVLLTDQCGFSEIEDWGGGLVTKATIDSLAQGICKMINKNNELDIMGQKLKYKIKSDYTWKVAADKLISLFKSILLVKI